MNRILFSSAAIVSAFAISGTVSAGVIVVQNGVPDLSNTILAAAPGDTVLVKGGGTDGVITITAKPLTIVVEPPGSYQVPGIQVRDLPAGQTCSVSGFVIAGQVVGVEVTNCAGSVRIADVTSGVASLGTPSIGAAVVNSPDVSFARCVLRSTNGPAFYPALACMTVGSGSRVAAFDSSFAGHDGSPGFWQDLSVRWQAGGAGVQVDATSQFFASASSLRGGNGGQGAYISCWTYTGGGLCLTPTAGASGGTALESAPGASSTLIGCALVPGNGGPGGTGGICCGSGGGPVGNGPNGASGMPSTGSLVTLPGNAVSAVIPTYARVNQTLPISITGQAGDAAYLAVSLGGQWFFAPSLGGVLTPGPVLRRIALGTIPGTGVLQTTFAVPELASVTAAFLLQLQPVTESPAIERHVGPGQTVCWLGPTY